MIRGIPIELEVRTPVGPDAFNSETFISQWITVENVLVAPEASQAMPEAQDLTGRKATYQLAIPKGDTNQWENARVRFFGRTWRVLGVPVEGIEAMIPLQWNRKVMVEILAEDPYRTES